MPRRPRTEAQKLNRKERDRQSEYKAARSKFNVHLHRHHQQSTLTGTLEERIEAHDDMHFISKREGIYLDHEHEPLGEAETLLDYAHRCFAEGETHHGKTDTTGSARQAAAVDSREGKR